MAGCTPAREPATVTRLLASEPFYVAHRGGRLDWPEMTLFAYEQAAALPFIQALEISVCLTSDGVLVCSHDPTTNRMTGVDHEIGQVPWSTLAPLTVSAEYTLDPTQPRRPLARLDEVLERVASSFVLFIEPKTAAALVPLQRRLVELAQPERTVWKQPINQPSFAWAKEQGFTTWGYALDEPSHSGERLKRFVADPAIDLIGIERTRTDAVISEVAGLARAAGKKTISWSIEDVAQRNRVLALGCQGLMAAEVRNLPTAPLP